MSRNKETRFLRDDCFKKDVDKIPGIGAANKDNLNKKGIYKA